MQEFEIIFYDKPDGTEPVKEFLDSLDVKMRAKILRTVLLLAANGTQLREPYSKPLDDGIFELSAKIGSDISRMLYFFIIEKSDPYQRFRQEDTENTRRGNRKGKAVSQGISEQKGHLK